MTRVLIVDDEEPVRRATAIVLEANGFEVAVVADGNAAVEAVRAAAGAGGRGFDIAIVDLFMPGMDGLATTKAMLGVTPHLAVIAVSGFMMRGATPLEMPNFHPMATEVGAVATLYKPFKPADLLGAIRKARGE